MELLTYLLKVSACTVLFFAFYLLVLRRLTFFKTNRFYLLVTLLLSFIIPTLNFTIKREVPAAAVVFDQPTIVNHETEVAQIQIPNQIAYSPIAEESFDWYSVLPYLYFGIVACLLIIATWRILQLVKHTKNGAERINGLKIVSKTKGFTNCSFFNYVFIDNENLTEAELQVLLKHEQVHVKQLHSVDKVLLIIAKAFLWFNPVVYLYDKALEQAHEYEADEATSQSFGTEQYANLLLRLAIAKSEMPLVHNFVKSPIKARIKMLFNSKSKNMKKLMYLLALPVVLGLLWGFTVKVVEVSTNNNNNDEKPFTLVLDAGHGGKDAGAKVNGYSEKEIALTMANKVKALAEAKGIKVITTRDGDEYVSLEDRAKTEGNILISLHVNSEPLANGGKRNGIEMFTAPNGEELKIAKANSITRYLFEGIKYISGINIKNQRQAKSLALLRDSKVPGVVLELGYLTNKNDLSFITNEAKQNELAESIVNGILLYKENTPTQEKTYNNSNKKDDLWGKTLKGKVKSILQTEVGEILNLKYEDNIVAIYNGAKSKVKLGDELIVTISGTVADIVVKDAKGKVIKKLENPCYSMSRLTNMDGKILYQMKTPIIKNVSLNGKTHSINSQDSSRTQKQILLEQKEKYGDLAMNVIKVADYNDSYFKSLAKQLTTNDKFDVVKAEIKTKYRDSLPKPVLLTSRKLTVDTKADVHYITGGRMQIGKDIIEAENMIWDRKNGLLTSEAATIKYANREVVSGENFEYDFKKGTYKMVRPFKYVPKDDLPSKAYQLISKLKFNADSIKRSDMLGDLLLRGNVKLNLDNYSLNARIVKVDRGSNIITSYLGSIKNPDGVIIKADVIEFDMITKKINTDKKLP